MSLTWATDLLAQESLRIPLSMIVAGCLLAVLFGNTRVKRRVDYSQNIPNDVRRPTNTVLWRRLWWRIRPPVDLMTIDGVVVDRTRRPHMAWLGPTGAGKSASVATVRVDGKRPTLIVTPDISDPLRAATLAQGGIIWTACESTLPIDFLIGTPQEVAERLTEVFRSGGVGAWKRAARRATADAIRILDNTSTPRTLQAIGSVLEHDVRSERELRTVCAGWVARFLDLADQFGPSIGAGGLDLADLLIQGHTVLLENDAFEHPALTEDIVALGLAEAKRIASRVPGGFRLIFEEAGQIGDRIDLAAPFFRAGRRRHITVDVLTQAESDLKHHGSDAITSNIATHIYFAQELKTLQQAAADRLGLEHTDLDPAKMKDFTAWLAHGRIRKLVRFPKPPRYKPVQSYAYSPTHLRSDGPTPRRTVIEEIGRPVRPSYVGLPPPSLKVQEILGQIDRSGECWLWTGRQDRDGYGLVWWERQNRRAHRIVWELTYGTIASGMDLDHQCRTRLCVRPEHLEPVTRGENSRRRWRVRGVSAS